MYKYLERWREISLYSLSLFLRRRKLKFLEKAKNTTKNIVFVRIF